MEGLTERMMELLQKRYHCSQVIVMLGQEMTQKEDPDFIRAMGGLAGGMYQRKDCGTLTGGCCLLATYVKKDNNDEFTAACKPMVQEYVQWFEQEFGHTQCEKLVSDDSVERLNFCPSLIQKSFIKCMEILTEHGYDPYE